ncbi:hypothetical protein C7Y66_14480 [Chroococcidiopsis sp. CCALA 051]|uniref:hypothetical protein n=1 Tax=Chroococcidiopsis sp. CCALA 051 TaxID=869949 RepID=UPI000D0D8CB2|nr:hypothetical protein [Chroococcidiopsis sp. CCALA 051]PSM48427.1 hypothetical protein C7Y66_14480 [Chroococcidiopsis sp. CCALA 051]
MNQNLSYDAAAWRKQFIALVMKRIKPGSGSSLEFLKSRTWNNPVTDIKSYLALTPFVIIGGVATRLYMVERSTSDLDILVLKENATRAERELKAAGAKFSGSLNFGGTSWQLPDGSSLDVIESGEPWAKDAIQNPNYSPNGLPVISLPYLVITKLQASRSQDLADISRMLGGAESEVLQQVRNAVKTYASDAVEDLEALIEAGKMEYQVATALLAERE